VNQNPPSQSGDAVENNDQRTPEHNHDSSAAAQSNSYSAQFEGARSAASNLDAHAPELKFNEMQRMNRRAIVLLLSLVCLMGVAAIAVVGHLLHSGKKDTSQGGDVVKIPPAPTLPSGTQVSQLVKPPLPRAELPQMPVRPIPVLPRMAKPQPLSPPLPPHVPTLMERRMADKSGAVAAAPEESRDAPAAAAMAMPAFSPFARGAAGGSGAQDATEPQNSAYRTKPLSAVSKVQALVHPNVLMVRGTYIRCVLETHIVTDIPGFTSCVVTEPIYSVNGKRLLLPKGSKALGKYESEPNGSRVAVIWDRVITPNGFDVSMASPGVDNLGGAGHPGYRDNHWPERISSALLISMFSDAFKYEAAVHGPSTTTITPSGLPVVTPFQSNTAQTVQTLADQAVRSAANRPATVTINQGTVITIYVAKDIDFSDVIAN
jgi:type IV secretion system protein VirB10